jgi:hypothetical protein
MKKLSTRNRGWHWPDLRMVPCSLHQSDPRAVILKTACSEMVQGNDFEKDYCMLETIEKLTPVIIDVSAAFPMSSAQKYR